MQGSQVLCEKLYVNCDILVFFTSVLERYMSTDYDSDRNTSVFVSNIAMMDFQLFF